MTTIYGNATDFVTYNEDRGRDVPVAWDADYIAAALLVASEWLDNAYKNLFVGYQTGGYTQDREWPRTTAVSNSFPVYIFATDEIPNEVVSATYEAAFRHATDPGCLRKDYTPSKYKSVSVSGAIQVQYQQYFQESDTQTKFGIIESLMESLIDLQANASSSSLSGSTARA